MQDPAAREDHAVKPVVAWLLDGAPGATTPDQVLAGLCARLLDAGLPLERVAVFVRTLHPDVMGRRLLWRAGAPVQVSEAAYGVLESDTYRASPMAIVFRTGETIRRRIEAPDCPNDFVILDELRRDGVTDYLVLPLAFTSGEIHAATFATTRPGGFTNGDLEALDAIRPPLARLAEIHALRRIAATLLDTYVGHDTGERILKGRIRRGDVEDIRAAILLADLRSFTELSDRHPGREVIALLNAYYDCLVPPTEAHGGDVLKFMGDGLLAIFPVADSDAGTVCAAALASAREASANLATANGERGGPDAPRLRMGMALHLGDVLYGNVGGAGRLDFTAIGPAVNLAARLEGLARDLGRELVISAAFAAHATGDEVMALGRFHLRGIEAAQEVYGLRAG